MALPTGSLDVLVRWAGVNVNGALVRVTGGPNSVDLTLTTPASGQVTFTDLPRKRLHVQATKSGQSASTTASVPASSSTSVTLNLPTGTVVVNVKRSSTNQNGATVRLALGPMGISVTGNTNSSGNVTFTNVPVGTGYTIQGWKCSVSNPKSGTLTNRTVNTGTNNFNIVFSTNTCPLPAP
jgi:hypothetical protein